MNDFTASNGLKMSRLDGDGLRVAIPPDGYEGWQKLNLHASTVVALRELFRAEDDQRLGRWRWPENPDYVVYPIPGADESHGGVTSVRVFRESTSAVGFYYLTDSGENTTENMGHAARAYFDAHPEPKPLPTVPGLYLGEPLGSLATIWSLDGAGRWLLINTNSVFPVEDGHIQKYLPFTRLIPEVS